MFCFSNVRYLNNLYTLCSSEVLVVYIVLHYNQSNPSPFWIYQPTANTYVQKSIFSRACFSSVMKTPTVVALHCIKPGSIWQQWDSGLYKLYAQWEQQSSHQRSES